MDRHMDRHMDRRSFFRQSAGAAVGVGLLSVAEDAAAERGVVDVDHRLRAGIEVWSQKYPFVLPPLGYAMNAVEPVVDAVTMGIHHDKHHAAYVTNLNKALETQSELHQYTLGELLMGLHRWPAAVQTAIRNNGGGHANHALYWALLAPPPAATTTAPSGRLGTAITRDFGTLADCIAALKAGGLGQFGSGWSWLVKTATNKVAVRALPNQDSPLMEGELPLVGIDVWEHAYYLKYQNRRADYLDAVLARVNWDVASAAWTG